MTCVRVGGKRRALCTGDLNRLISIQSRAIVPPVYGSVDFAELFATTGTTWANIQTVTGKTFFDGVNQRDETVTHEIYIRYDSAVNAESWILMDDGRHIDILAVENLDERNTWLKLTCVDKGEKLI